MITIKRILCPTNLSPEADEALRYAVALSRTYQSTLFVLTWREDLPPVKTLVRLELIESLRKSVEQSLASYVPVGDMAALDWRFVLAEGHDAADAIVREATERGVDLVVMRSRRRPLAAALLGSTAEAVSRTAPCPVLVTHPQEREWVGVSTGEIDLERILIAYDFSDYAPLVLRLGLSLAQEYQAELHLLHVSAPLGEIGPEIAQSSSVSEGTYQRAMRQAVPTEAHLWCEIKTAVRWGKPYREILSYAGENRIDLICIGARGSGRSLQTLLGSNVDRVLRHAPCPVLVARPLGQTNFTSRFAAVMASSGMGPGERWQDLGAIRHAVGAISRAVTPGPSKRD